MAAKKRVVISGYYGFDNTGDEAVLYSILKALEKECKKDSLEIIVLSNQPEKTSEKYKVGAINRWDMKKVYQELKNCDLLISGGGSLLQDVTSHKTVPYYLLIIKMAQWHKKEVVFYSQGYGPVNKAYSRTLIKKVLNKVNYIYVRDQQSKKSLQEIGVSHSPIILAADPVLGMEADVETTLKMKEYVKKHSKGKLPVGIYLRSWKNDDQLREKIKILVSLLEKENMDLFFIAMQEPDDQVFLEKLQMETASFHKVREKLDIQEVFALTGQMDLVIGMRLHALIMATAQGIPTVGLSYDPKVDDFMDSIDNKHCFDVETFNPQELARSVMTQVANIQKEKESILYKRKELIEKVYQPAKSVAKILS